MLNLLVFLLEFETLNKTQIMHKRFLLCFLILASLFPLNSCRKKDQVLHVSGTLLRDCDLMPMANVRVSVSSISNLITHGTSAETQTDSLGHFDIAYDPSGMGLNFYVNGNWVLGEIPMTENVDLGIFVAYPNAEYVISIDFGNSFSSKDTLFLFNYSSYTKVHKISGPFKDTILPLDTCYPIGYEARHYGPSMNHFN